MTPHRQPVFNIPTSVLAVLFTLAAVHVVRGLLSADMAADVILRFAFVPIRASALVHGAAVSARLTAWAASSDTSLLRDHDLALAFLTASPGSVALSFVSYAFLHGDWTHLAFNAFWLLAFGSPVARRFGTPRFLALLIVAAVAGAVAHWLCFPFGADPVIGASAAVSGCMGAATRFAFTDAPVSERAPAESLATTLRDRRALSFVLVWFLSNALFGIGSFTFGFTNAPVAWQAHVGGFLVGLLAFRLFDRRAPELDVRPVEPIESSSPPPA